MPSTIVWTKGATTLTWANGGVEVQPESYQSSVLTERLAGGEIDAEDLGLGPLKQRFWEFRNVSDAIKQAFETFRDTTVNGPYATFTHTDNSKATPEALTVRLLQSSVDRATFDSTPVWRILATIGIEPA